MKALRKFYENIPPYYMAQVQLQMAVFDCDSCLFVQVVQESYKHNTIKRDEHFIKNNLNECKKFIEEYEHCIKNQDDFIITALSHELIKVRSSLSELKKQEEKLKAIF